MPAVSSATWLSRASTRCSRPVLAGPMGDTAGDAAAHATHTEAATLVGRGRVGGLELRLQFLDPRCGVRRRARARTAALPCGGAASLRAAVSSLDASGRLL